MGRDILAAGGDDEVLFAIDDEQESVLVEFGDVAGGEESVFGKNLGGLLGLVPVTGHDARPADQELAVLGELDLNVVERLAHGAETDLSDL